MNTDALRHVALFWIYVWGITYGLFLLVYCLYNTFKDADFIAIAMFVIISGLVYSYWCFK